MEIYRKTYPGIFTAFPGDEEKFGGCLAAGRGFLHINQSGEVEPCPFAPFSDINIISNSLKEALDSDFLKTIRENHEKLSEAEGGCALWYHKEWVNSIYNLSNKNTHSNN